MNNFRLEQQDIFSVTINEPYEAKPTPYLIRLIISFLGHTQSVHLMASNPLKMCLIRSVDCRKCQVSQCGCPLHPIIYIHTDIQTFLIHLRSWDK